MDLNRKILEFSIRTAYEKAKKIISEKEKIIASKKDSEIFFDAIINSPRPNNNLVNATNEYKNLLFD